MGLIGFRFTHPNPTLPVKGIAFLRNLFSIFFDICMMSRGESPLSGREGPGVSKKGKASAFPFHNNY